MRGARLGCFTFIGFVAALVTALVIVGFAVASGGQMFSPGALNAVAGDVLGGVHSHAEIGGACSACHVPPWSEQTMDDRCVVCHQDITLQMQDLMTPHGRMYAIDPQAECRACHPEHRGETASLTEIEGWKYPHELSGYFLTAHQFKAENEPFKCVDCHGSDVTTFDEAACESCHGQRDQAFMVDHVLAYGESCLQCHNGHDSMVTGFSHDAFQFKLIGQHAQAACVDCHRGSHSLAEFRMQAQDCASCHFDDDAHEGMLGQDCASCHTAEGWSPSHFDHNRSAFKLGEAHADVACRACHQDNLFKGTPSDCFACHAQDDPHQGVLGTNCASCHKTTTWQDVTFDHSTTAFALVGRHVNVACMKCHHDLTFKGTPTACVSCHTDIHQGQMGTDCAKCHNPFDWKDVHFDHSQTGFNLVGAHQGLACSSCHANGRFKGTPSNCFACHAADDKHNGQFGADCGSCHNPSSWKDVNFDHSRTGFPLAGAHSGVRCTACHVNGVYKGTPRECVACHAADDAHNGQFGTVCSACHTPTSWQNATFDHSKTGFPLTGSHSGVACKNCHSNGVFKGTPSNCYACHAGNDKHNGQFGTDCGACHKPTRWSDVNFNHNSTGFPLNGKHAGVQCKACHSNGYKGTPSNCYACHAGNDKHNGQFGTDCGSCHSPNGWGNASFNHNRTAFPLEGKHANLDCKKCHQNGVYKGTPTQCAACHEDKHNGEKGSDCAACHSPRGWGD